MNTATNSRLMIFKAVLWFLVGAATTTALYRLVLGLGATSALSDAIPWGLWKGFNVLACIPMAAGGFVIAGAVHCFHLEKYRAIVRPTVLIAFLGYMTAVTGLLLDIGRPWNIWRPIFYWNVHSPLFEVAWCIMIYATVMLAEFAPVVGERFGWSTFVHAMKRLTPVLAVLAVAISTLHQSTLGTLFTLSPERLHPLWYSPILNILFLISAIGMGLTFLTLQFLLTSWLYRREAPWGILRGMIRTAAWVLGLYGVLRLGDLAVRGQLAVAFDGSHWAGLFWTELLLSTVIPIALFTHRATRGRPWAIVWGSVMAVSGVMLQRLGVGAFSQYPVVGFSYVPTMSEFAITFGVIGGLGLIFLFFVENLKVWRDTPDRPDHFSPPAIDPLTRTFIRAPWLGGPQRAALAWTGGLVLGLVIMEVQLPLRAAPTARPVDPARIVLIQRTERADGPGHVLSLATLASLDAAEQDTSLTVDEPETALLFGGAESTRAVLFEHVRHQQRLGGPQSCAQCHHRNLLLEIGTPCSRCHRDMYRTTDTFDHQRHVATHGKDASCALCHLHASDPKTRAGSKACDDCHPPVATGATRVVSRELLAPGIAPGYHDALHGLCLECHRAHDAEVPYEQPTFSLCSCCHQEAVVARARCGAGDDAQPEPEVDRTLTATLVGHERTR